MDLVRSDRPGRPSSSHDATASATVYVRDDLGARPSSSRSLGPGLHHRRLGRAGHPPADPVPVTAVLVEPVTLRRIRFPLPPSWSSRSPSGGSGSRYRRLGRAGHPPADPVPVTAVLVAPVTLRPIRFPSAAHPRLTEPR